MLPGVSVYEPSPKQSTTTSAAWAACTAAGISTSVSTSVGVELIGPGPRLILVPGTYVTFALAIFSSIAVRIVRRSFGNNEGSEPCQTQVQPLFREIIESAVGPVTSTFLSFANGNSLFVFFKSVIDSWAACRLACRYSGKPTFAIRAGLGFGFSNRPS